MTNEQQHREMRIAAITIGLMLFFAAASLSGRSVIVK